MSGSLCAVSLCAAATCTCLGKCLSKNVMPPTCCRDCAGVLIIELRISQFTASATMLMHGTTMAAVHAAWIETQTRAGCQKPHSPFRMSVTLVARQLRQ